MTTINGNGGTIPPERPRSEGNFDTVMRALPAISSFETPRDVVGNPVEFRTNPAGQTVDVIKTRDGRLLEPITARTYQVTNPNDPADVTTRKTYTGSFEAMPSTLRQAMVRTQIEGNDIPDYKYASEEKVVGRFAAPGKTMLATVQVGPDGAETLIGIGAATAGHGVTKTGEVQDVTYLQHLVGGRGSGMEIATEVEAIANRRGTHLVFDSYDPANELPGAIYSAQRFAPDWSAPTTIYDPHTLLPAEAQVQAEMRQAAGLQADAKVDAGISLVLPIGPFDKTMGHNDAAIRAAMFPEMAGKEWHALSREQQATWTATVRSWQGQTPLLDWEGNLRRTRDGQPILADYPTGTETQMGKITPNGPHDTEGNAVLPAYYFTSKGLSNSYPTTSLASAPFGQSGRPGAPAPNAGPDGVTRTPMPYRLKAGGEGSALVSVPLGHRTPAQWVGAAVQGGVEAIKAGRAAVDAKLDQVGGAVERGKKAVGTTIGTRVLTPLAQSPAGRTALDMLIAAEVAKTALTGVGSGTVASPGQTGFRTIHQERVPNGAVPLNPERSATRATTPATVGTQTELYRQQSATHGQLAYSVGSPAVPPQYWAGTPGMAFGKPLPLEFALRPGITKAVNATAGAIKLAGNAVTGAGVATLAAAGLTGSLQTGHFVSDAPDRTIQDTAIDRIVNLPKGTEMAYVSAKIPFTPDSANMRSTAYVGQKSQPFYFKAAVLPGQKGVTPWADVADGRLKAVFQNTAGQNIGFTGMLVGNENLYVNKMLIANVPRGAVPMASVDVLPNAKRQTPVDVQVGLMAAPIGVFGLTDYGVDTVRVTDGVMISPAAARVMIGTEGFKGSALKIGRPDVITFKAVSPNPSYRADGK